MTALRTDELDQVIDGAPPIAAETRRVPGLRAIERWLAAYWVDIAIVSSITVFAAVLRIWQLADVPLGMHGDEAVTGLDAQRVLDEGWIGAYVGSAAGQTTGPLYFTALLFTFMPDTTFTVRLSMALFGVGTIPLAYLAFAQMFNRRVAAFAALILAVMMWHLHLNRIGFLLNAWPFTEMAALASIWLAMRHRNPWTFVLAGAMTGLVVHSYNAALLFVPVAFVPIAWMLIAHRSRPRVFGAAYMAVLFAASALLVAMPLIRFAYEQPDLYRGHQRVVSVFNDEAWVAADGWDVRADILWERAKEWHTGLMEGGRPQSIDGLSTPGHPPVHPLIYVLALVGLGLALMRFRRPEYAVLIAAVVILPWGGILTVDAGLFRRTFGLAPFVAVLAALPLAALWDALMSNGRRWGPALACGLLVVPAYVGAQTIQQYFGPVQDSHHTWFAFPAELDRASNYINGLPAGTHVYFYSGRSGFLHETRRFIAPNATGEDRSAEFRDRERFPDQSAPVDVTIDVEGPVAFVFLPPYTELIDEVRRAYPGGAVEAATRDDQMLFVAYHLPEGAP